MKATINLPTKLLQDIGPYITVLLGQDTASIYGIRGHSLDVDTNIEKWDYKTMIEQKSGYSGNGYATIEIIELPTTEVSKITIKRGDVRINDIKQKARHDKNDIDTIYRWGNSKSRSNRKYIANKNERIELDRNKLSHISKDAKYPKCELNSWIEGDDVWAFDTKNNWKEHFKTQKETCKECQKRLSFFVNAMDYVHGSNIEISTVGERVLVFSKEYRGTTMHIATLAPLCSVPKEGYYDK